ncbi:MAG: hypothetical protein RLO52_18850 [Sandaracinaceae bacterium]|nr:MAG: hypothetical protein EVA89_17180 [Sandaracinaceae bacterium]HBQ18668.1 hypothetical protein [Myxococcales bacterium]
MASPRKKKTENRRGSREAVAKRRVARALNQLFERKAHGVRDGRTEKRRRRLLKELKQGRSGQPLQPSDVVSHASELLALGETLGSIRKNGVLQSGFSATPETVRVAREVQTLNGYDPRAWKLLGIDLSKAK